jgi:hypothetical protein
MNWTKYVFHPGQTWRPAAAEDLVEFSTDSIATRPGQKASLCLTGLTVSIDPDSEEGPARENIENQDVCLF